jgi:ribosomal protein S18 acetylase RimI-like enzyme
LAGAADCAAVRKVAEASFRFSRFHLDPKIPNDVADRIKGDWAENYFRGARGDGMVVAELDGEVAGFLQLLWSGPKLVIDLIAVAPHAARRGLARGMISFAWTKGTGDERGPSSMLVGTQAVNIPSCRLYEGLGFRLSAASIVMHHHGGEQRV